MRKKLIEEVDPDEKEKFQFWLFSNYPSYYYRWFGMVKNEE